MSMTDKHADAMKRFAADNADLCGPVNDLLERMDRLFHDLEKAAEYKSQYPGGQIRQLYATQARQAIGECIATLLTQAFNAGSMTYQLEADDLRKTAQALRRPHLSTVAD